MAVNNIKLEWTWLDTPLNPGAFHDYLFMIHGVDSLDMIIGLMAGENDHTPRDQLELDVVGDRDSIERNAAYYEYCHDDFIYAYALIEIEHPCQ